MCWGDFLGLIVLVEESALACNRKQNIFLLGGFNLGGSGGGYWGPILLMQKAVPLE